MNHDKFRFLSLAHREMRTHMQGCSHFNERQRARFMEDMQSVENLLRGCDNDETLNTINTMLGRLQDEFLEIHDVNPEEIRQAKEALQDLLRSAKEFIEMKKEEVRQAVGKVEEEVNDPLNPDHQVLGFLFEKDRQRGRLH